MCRCTIDWTKGKNVTLKTIKKKQKHKGRGTVRTVTKTVPNDSFFNFFSPPEGTHTPRDPSGMIEFQIHADCHSGGVESVGLGGVTVWSLWLFK